ncbi:MAG: hypothetical protein KDE55_15865 [Novosphingobium sp.]|nr:hypothetical protein [Novosphingobium sp.]
MDELHLAVQLEMVPAGMQEFTLAGTGKDQQLHDRVELPIARLTARRDQPRRFFG